MGHLTISATSTYTLGTTKNAETIPYGWGIYVDNDAVSAATSIQPYADARSNAWMVHKVGVVGSAGLLTDGTRASFFATDLVYRRYDLDLRRYKRKLDSFSDTLRLMVQNAATASPGAVSITTTYFFRMLMVE
jgi:hypothetical protein